MDGNQLIIFERNLKWIKLRFEKQQKNFAFQKNFNRKERLE